MNDLSRYTLLVTFDDGSEEYFHFEEWEEMDRIVSHELDENEVDNYKITYNLKH